MPQRDYLFRRNWTVASSARAPHYYEIIHRASGTVAGSVDMRGERWTPPRRTHWRGWHAGQGSSVEQFRTRQAAADAAYERWANAQRWVVLVESIRPGSPTLWCTHGSYSGGLAGRYEFSYEEAQVVLAERRSSHHRLAARYWMAPYASLPRPTSDTVLRSLRNNGVALVPSPLVDDEDDDDEPYASCAHCDDDIESSSFAYRWGRETLCESCYESASYEPEDDYDDDPEPGADGHPRIFCPTCSTHNEHFDELTEQFVCQHVADELRANRRPVLVAA